MTTSSLSPSSLELELWKHVCRASAHYQRAQRLTLSSTNYEYNGVEDNTNALLSEKTATSSTPQSIDNDDVVVRRKQRVSAAINDAEHAYRLYRSCHARVMSMSTSTTRSSSTSPGSVVILREDDGGNCSIANDAMPRPSSPNSKKCIDEGRGTRTTVNLELRLAQTLRLLATLYASSSSSSSNSSSNSDIGERNGNLEMAIKYHDRAVSLLVGVFEEDNEDEDKLDEMGDDAAVKKEEVVVGRDRSSSITSLETPMATLIWANPGGGIAGDDGVNDGDDCVIADTDGIDDDDGNVDGGILLTINVPIINDNKLPIPLATPSNTMSFLRPSENQRVLAISTSLNTLATLHATAGNDSAAMSAYREALEILQAANNAEEEGENNDNNNNNNDTEKKRRGVAILSPIATDLADTLTNVGNFHLRRDELDAAHNAYSTVWGLYDKILRMDNENDTPPVGIVAIAAAADASATSTQRSKLTLSFPNGALIAMNNLGVVHERRSEFHEALSCYEAVYRIRLRQQRLQDKKDDNNDNNINIDVINPLLNIGNVHHRLQQYDEAYSTYSEVVRMCKSATRILTNEDGDTIVRILQTLAGALRNWGSCYLEQCRFHDAIDKISEASKLEDDIISVLIPSTTSAPLSERTDQSAAVKRAKESKAQLLGLLGCLYLECKDDGLISLDKSAESFRHVIDTLGHTDDENHSKIVWAKHNLNIVDNLRSESVATAASRVALVHLRESSSPAPPPPPKTTTSSLSYSIPSYEPQITHVSQSLPAATNDDQDVDSTIELDEVLGSDEKYEDHITSDDSDSTFKGLFVSSTDELEDFLSRTGDSAIIETDGDGERSIVTKDNLSTSRRVSSSFIPQLPSSSSSASAVPSQQTLPEPVIMGSDTMDHSVEKARDFVILAEDLWKKGDISGATENFTIAHSIYITHLGDADSSKEVAMILKKLGDLNQEDGALDASLELYLEAIEMEMTAYGQHLPQTLNAAGVICLKRDDFRSAMEFHRRALQIQKRSQGVGETGGLSKYETYETLVNIGNVYYSERNNFSNIRSNGVDYKEFIESGFLSWIALAHDMRGEYVRSIQFYEESLQISMTRKTKESKRETALTLNRLGSLTRELGRYDEAMDYHQKAMNIHKSGNVGISKATAAETCVLMGMVKSKLSDFQTALHLYEDSLIVLKKSLGEDHLSVSKTMAQIGSVHYELSNWEKALECLADAEELQLSTVGEMNRDTLETQALIGRVLSATGNFEEALLKLKTVYERQNILFNSTHPTIADTLSYIGDCFLDQDMATEARGKFVDCYNMRKNFFTIDQIHIAESMVDIIRARSGQPGRALEIYQNAQEVYSEYLPDNHVQIGRLRVYEGDSFAELLNFTTAIERYEQAKQIFYKAFGGEFNIDYATCTVSIGRALLRKCDYDSAKNFFTSALVIYQQILPEEHLKIKRTLVDLERVEQEEALCV